MSIKLNKSLKIKIVIFLSIVFLYKIGREVFYVIRDTSEIDDNLIVSIKYDPELLGFIDPLVEKKILIRNLQSKAVLEIELESIEWNLYFYVDEFSKRKELRIVDQYLGQNIYDYNTLKIKNEEDDCFKFPEKSCGGFSEKSLKALGNPILIYTLDGFFNESLF